MGIAMRPEVNTSTRLVQQAPGKAGIYQRSVKRPMDVVLSLGALVLLSPIMLLIALLVWINLGSPVIFRQNRPGLNERIFTLYKFRTMADVRDEHGELLPDSVRLTRLGQWLRSTSLDELPELVNVLKGDMSLVGPRPQLIKDLVFMTDEQRARHSVLPGLTGLAQVRGRNQVEWDERLQFDVRYANNVTFLGDLKIMLRTLVEVVRRNGIATENMATSEDLGDYLLRTGRIDEGEYRELLAESRQISAAKCPIKRRH